MSGDPMQMLFFSPQSRAFSYHAPCFTSVNLDLRPAVLGFQMIDHGRSLDLLHRRIGTRIEEPEETQRDCEYQYVDRNVFP